MDSFDFIVGKHRYTFSLIPGLKKEDAMKMILDSNKNAKFINEKVAPASNQNTEK